MGWMTILHMATILVAEETLNSIELVLIISLYIYIIIYIYTFIYCIHVYTMFWHVLTLEHIYIYTINDGDLNVTSLQMMVDKGNSLNMALCDVRSGWCMIYTSLFIQMYQSRICWFGTSQTYLVGGLEHEFYHFPLSWECHNPNWRSHIFQRGRSSTNQICFPRTLW